MLNFMTPSSILISLHFIFSQFRGVWTPPSDRAELLFVRFHRQTGPRGASFHFFRFARRRQLRLLMPQRQQPLLPHTDDRVAVSESVFNAFRGFKPATAPAGSSEEHQTDLHPQQLPDRPEMVYVFRLNVTALFKQLQGFS